MNYYRSCQEKVLKKTDRRAKPNVFTNTCKHFVAKKHYTKTFGSDFSPSYCISYYITCFLLQGDLFLFFFFFVFELQE